MLSKQRCSLHLSGLELLWLIVIVGSVNALTVSWSCRQNGTNEFFKNSSGTRSRLQACKPPASHHLCPLGTFKKIPLISFSSPPQSFRVHAILTVIPSLTPLLSFSPILIAPSRSCSMPCLTCLRVAVMKILKRRRILHGFSLGPGTHWKHGVGVYVFVCACSVRCMIQWFCEPFH